MTLHLTIGLSVVMLAMAAPAGADTPGRHPRYLHALADLRYARALLSRPDEVRVARDQRAAIEEIDKAIFELKNASYDDRKNLRDHTPIDSGWERAGRLRKALEALNGALRDIEEEEDNPAARGWRNVAIRYIRDAEAFTEKAIRDKRHFE